MVVLVAIFSINFSFADPLEGYALDLVADWRPLVDTERIIDVRPHQEPYTKLTQTKIVSRIVTVPGRIKRKTDSSKFQVGE